MKKFNRKNYLNDLKNYVANLNNNDAYTICKGVYLLFEHMDKYYKDIYGSNKRLNDIIDYTLFIQKGYFENELKEAKEQKELPY